jgi:hypothetical protein
VIDYEVRQVSRWPIRNSPLGALLDPDKDVARYARLVPTTNPNVPASTSRTRAIPNMARSR